MTTPMLVNTAPLRVPMPSMRNALFVAPTPDPTVKAWPPPFHCALLPATNMLLFDETLPTREAPELDNLPPLVTLRLLTTVPWSATVTAPLIASVPPALTITCAFVPMVNAVPFVHKEPLPLTREDR